MVKKPPETRILHKELGPAAPGSSSLPLPSTCPVTERDSNSSWSFLSGFRLISLKVLNSIVLLGKSCQYVKEAKMEEKLFNPPPTSAPSKPSSKSQNKCKPSQGRFGSFYHFYESFYNELIVWTPLNKKITVQSMFSSAFKIGFRFD